MKLLRFSALLLLIISTVSCKKVPVMNVTNATISFKMDGVFKEAKGNKNVFALYAKDENIIQIAGNIAGKQIITVNIVGFRGVGEYKIDDGEFLGTYSIPEEILNIISTEGKVKVTEYIEGKSIKGEFQFNGTHMIISDDPNYVSPTSVFSEGKFDVKITPYSGEDLMPD